MECHREGVSATGSSPVRKRMKCIREPVRVNHSIRIRRRALNVLSEGRMPLIRVEPRINSSLREEFVRFLLFKGNAFGLGGAAWDLSEI